MIFLLPSPVFFPTSIAPDPHLHYTHPLNLELYLYIFPCFFRSQASLSELESEVSVLREGLKGVEKELSFHKSRNEGGISDPNDKFVNVISEFVTVASCKFSDLEDAVKDMKVEVGCSIEFALVGAWIVWEAPAWRSKRSRIAYGCRQ